MVKVCRRGHKRSPELKRCRECDTTTRRLWKQKNVLKIKEDFAKWRNGKLLVWEPKA